MYIALFIISIISPSNYYHTIYAYFGLAFSFPFFSSLFLSFLFKIYLLIWQTVREHSKGSSRGRGRSRWWGAPSQDSGIMTWAKGRCLTTWATQAPLKTYFIWTSGRLSQLSTCLWLRSWSQGPEIEPPSSGSLLGREPASPSLSPPHTQTDIHTHFFWTVFVRESFVGAPGWFSWWSDCLWLRSWSQCPGTEPMSGSLLKGESQLLPLPLPLPLLVFPLLLALSVK